MLKEFQAFAMRGNVVDLAIGVIIGASFGKIVDAVVNNILMPIIGLLTGGMDFSKMQLVLRTDAEGVVTSAIGYGALISTIIQFLIIAWVLFLIVKAMTAMQKKAAEAPAAPPAPSAQEVLLTEIRDLLARR
jgi:large conductance mechanosensitive channel